MITRNNERGFILATSLVLLLLMGMMTAAVMVSVNASQRSSASAEASTEAFYYAETAVNYVGWALLNNADFDSYTYPQVVRDDGAADLYSFGEPDVRGDPAGDPYVYLPTPAASGDYDEWRANRFNPSGDNRVVKVDGTYVQNAGVDVYGQLMHYDNSPLAGRIISYQSDDLYTYGGSGRPTMYNIHLNLPRYIMLTVDSYGNVTPSMPPVNDAAPWHNNVEGVDFPTNGALVWLTGGDQTDDIEIDPVDNYFAPIIFDSGTGSVWDRYAAYIGRLACDVYTMTDTAAACLLTSGSWVSDTNYGLVIYALGYAKGKPQRLVRVIYE